MFRILHTACAGLLVLVALLGYGVKEETSALRREVATLEREKRDLDDEIAALQAEWAHFNDPDVLAEIAAAVYGPERMIGFDGGVLQPWRPEQLVEIGDLRRRDDVAAGPGRGASSQ